MQSLRTEALRMALRTEALSIEALRIEALYTITLRIALRTEALHTEALRIEALRAALYMITSIWRVFFLPSAPRIPCVYAYAKCCTLG